MCNLIRSEIFIKLVAHDFQFSFRFKLGEGVEIMWFKCVVLLALCLNLDCKPHSGGENVVELDEDSIRLPGNTRPINYDIELDVNVHDGSTPYEGKVIIKIAVDVATDVITLHNKGLSVTRVKVIDLNSEEIANTHELDQARDFLNINVDGLLTVGSEYFLEISFSGEIAQATSGFYRMSYGNVKSNEIR